MDPQTKTPDSPDDPSRSALFTDLYELAMAQAYEAEAMEQTAVFELFYRKPPQSRNFVVAAGLDDVLTYLESFRFSGSDLAYLSDLGSFSEAFLDRLGDLRFAGDVHAVPEGTVVFSNEPIVQVTAPILQAQLVETFILNQIHFQTVAASKCARVTIAARDRAVVEFGARRAHGADAALKIARASYIAGHLGTSNVLAGKRFGIPLFGTMAHSYIQSHEDQATAFEAFARLYPETTLLVDTYDTLEGVRKVIELGRKMGDQFSVRAIRLDSGDLVAFSKQARQMLDEAGLSDVTIFASGGLDEYKLATLVEAGAPIDGFGVGTSMVVSDDAPTLEMAYKLVEFAGKPSMKTSTGKVTYPGRKQVFRFTEGDQFSHDILARYGESLPGGESLLKPAMRKGRRLSSAEVSLDDIRNHTARQLARLPAALRALEPASIPYPVEISAALQAETELLQASL